MERSRQACESKVTNVKSIAAFLLGTSEFMVLHACAIPLEGGRRRTSEETDTKTGWRRKERQKTKRTARTSGW